MVQDAGPVSDGVGGFCQGYGLGYCDDEKRGN